MEAVNLIFNFDINKKYELPLITLANPDRTEIMTLGNINNLHIKPRFNAVSELNFDIPEIYFDNIQSKNVNHSAYSDIKKNKLLNVTGFGWFVIVSIEEINEGNTAIKTVNAYSYEYVLNSKGANISSGTYKFYDPVNPQDTLLQKLIDLAPSWKIGNISSSLISKYRTFETPSSTLYSFLMEDVEKAYNCIFEFDTEKKLINAYTSEEIVKETDISLSFYNLLKNVNITETTSDIITTLSIRGSGDLTINEVNPLGTTNIYNFDYYKTSDWMDRSLISSINKWEEKIKSNEKIYSSLLLEVKTLNEQLVKLNGELETLKNDLKAQELVRSSKLPNIDGKTKNTINSLNSSISQKNKEISETKTKIANNKNKLVEINNNLKLENNFNSEEILKLDSFIFEGSYTNEKFVITTKMNNVEIQEMASELFKYGTEELKRMSQPSFTFSMDVVNFLFAEKFKPFIEQIHLGHLIHAEIRKDVWVLPILLEMDIDYDNPENFTMTFGNQFRLQTNEWTFKELYN